MSSDFETRIAALEKQVAELIEGPITDTAFMEILVTTLPTVLEQLLSSGNLDFMQEAQRTQRKPKEITISDKGEKILAALHKFGVPANAKSVCKEAKQANPGGTAANLRWLAKHGYVIENPPSNYALTEQGQQWVAEHSTNA